MLEAKFKQCHADQKLWYGCSTIMTIHLFFLLPSDVLPPVNDEVKHAQPTRHSEDDKEQNTIVLDDNDEKGFLRTADVVHLTNHSYHATDIEAYTKCMLRLEECNQVFFPQYANAQQPFSLSVMIVDDHFYNIMSLFVTANPDAWRHPNTTYACNGINCGIVLHARTLVVKCPQSLSPSSDAVISSLSIVFKGGETTSRLLQVDETTKVEYNLDK